MVKFYIRNSYLILFLVIGISQIWAEGIIVPIFKNGVKDDPVNYRGLTIGRNSCKLFTTILNTRLDKFCIKRQLNVMNILVSG